MMKAILLMITFKLNTIALVPEHFKVSMKQNHQLVIKLMIFLNI